MTRHWENEEDRSCDTCGGEGGTFRSDGSIIGICAACDGTGRHTFVTNNTKRFGDLMEGNE